MPKQNEEIIYTEEYIRVIKPLKARIWSEEYEKQEMYGTDGIKTLLFRKVEVKEENN